MKKQKENNWINEEDNEYFHGLQTFFYVPLCSKTLSGSNWQWTILIIQLPTLAVWWLSCHRGYLIENRYQVWIWLTRQDCWLIVFGEFISSYKGKKNATKSNWLFVTDSLFPVHKNKVSSLWKFVFFFIFNDSSTCAVGWWTFFCFFVETIVDSNSREKLNNTSYLTWPFIWPMI